MSVFMSCTSTPRPHGEFYDDAEIENYITIDITRLDDEDRANITLAGWLQEMLSWGAGSVVGDEDI